AERFVCNMRKLAVLAPRFPEKIPKQKVLELTAEKIDKLAFGDGIGEAFPSEPLRLGGEMTGYGIAPVQEQHFVDVDLYRAHFGAVAAKAGSIAQVFKLGHATEVWRNE